MKRSTSLKSRLLALTMAITTISLLFTGVAILIYDIKSERTRIAEGTAAIGRVVSANSTAALAFQDEKSLTETLSSLAQHGSITMACAYVEKGVLLGQYQRDRASPQCPQNPGGKSLEFSEEGLWVRQPVTLDERAIGTILIKSDLSAMRNRIYIQIGIVTAVLLFAAALAFLLASGLQRFVSRPILLLAETAKRVTQERDYSIRAETPRPGSAETQFLIEVFNAMLDQIESLLAETRAAVQVRDEFMSIASHELRTPLTPLKAQVQIIQRLIHNGQIATYPQERLERFAVTVDQQINRLTSLIGNLLDVTRLTQGRFELQRERIDLVEVVREVVERFSFQNRGFPLRLELPSQATGFWDRVRVEQIIVNLMTNAIRYGNGKPITIAVCNRENEVMLDVRDEGVGIAPENQSKIFDRFAQVGDHQKNSGLGLGLYITRQIVEAHGGSIDVKSSLGHGTEFTVTLPIRTD